ncbi:hypothetical protein R6138_04577 [Ralstonia thomasii]|nr:hypothetical protein R6138_04577 [Ralstonia sp. LMG 18095]
MSATDVILFVDGKARWWLQQAKRDASGQITQAHVANGGWRWRVEDGELLCKTQNGYGNLSHVVSRFPLPKYEEVPRLPTWRGDYNEVMSAAQAHYDKEAA